jgi:hypothetical protein
MYIQIYDGDACSPLRVQNLTVRFPTLSPGFCCKEVSSPGVKRWTIFLLQQRGPKSNSPALFLFLFLFLPRNWAETGWSHNQNCIYTI